MPKFTITKMVTQDHISEIEAETIEEARDYVYDFEDDLEWNCMDQDEKIVSIIGDDNQILFLGL